MPPVAQFEFILLLLAVILCLDVAARWLRAPPAAALIVGGAGLAFIPGVPPIALNPDLVLTLFLPPLLAASAYLTVWREFRRNIASILLLAVGAVVFTTLCVGVAVHFVVPGLPWAVCFTLGAVVSPPDAVAAKAVLGRVKLPRRTMALLEGESLLNDASGIVLFRFAVVAALTGSFSVVHATFAFGLLAFEGIAIGVATGASCVLALRVMKDANVAILMTLLLPWAAYIGADRIGGSGVIATVVAGMILGWYQHDVLTADARRTANAVWQLVIFVMEALVFVLIGLSLRGVLGHLGGMGLATIHLGPAIGATVAAVILSRFVWSLCSDRLRVLFHRLAKRRDAMPIGPAIAMSWAGMRGVVTLAIALSLPDDMPGRDLILLAAFMVILVTVLIQGTTLGIVIRLLGIDSMAHEGEALMTEMEARAAIATAQLATIEARAYDADGAVRHPRLLEQYTFRAGLFQRVILQTGINNALRDEHFTLVLAAVARGRAEAIALQRTGRIEDETLHTLEYDLDLQEVAALRVLGPR